jgi:hypothetical protein
VSDIFAAAKWWQERSWTAPFLAATAILVVVAQVCVSIVPMILVL